MLETAWNLVRNDSAVTFSATVDMAQQFGEGSRIAAVAEAAS